MLPLITILVFLNTLIGVVWWTSHKRAWTACLAAFIGLGLMTAFTLTTHERLLEFVHTDMDDISAAAQKAEEEAAAATELREKMEREFAEFKRLAAEAMPAQPAVAPAPEIADLRTKLAASTAEVEQLNKKLTEAMPAQPAAPAPEMADLRTKLAASTAEVEQLNKNLAEARQRISELQGAAPALAIEPPQSLPRSREIAPPAQSKARRGKHAASQKGLLKQRFDEAIEFHKLEQDGLAYVAAKACVELYESSRDAGKMDGPDLGGVTLDGAAAIYSVGAEICQRVDQHGRAVEWAERAVTISPSPERKALLAIAYLNVKRRAEAEKIIEEANSGDNPASLELRKLLTEFGVIKEAEPEGCD